MALLESLCHTVSDAQIKRRHPRASGCAIALQQPLRGESGRQPLPARLQHGLRFDSYVFFSFIHIKCLDFPLQFFSSSLEQTSSLY